MTITTAQVSENHVPYYGNLVKEDSGLTEEYYEQEIDAKTVKRLETAVSKSPYSQGKKLKVSTKVNPELLGGLVVEIGEQTIDYSVASKISKMNKLLTDSV